MRPGLVLTLSSSLFKSYLRSSRGASVSFFSRPRLMLVVDIILFAVPAATLPYAIGALSPDLATMLLPLMLQTMVSLPVLVTLATIITGLLFELGQGSAISSSEAVNWLPVSPREYVAASALSTSWLYSFFLALAAGVTLPLAVNFELFYMWPLTILLSALSLLLGAFIVELLKATVNRVSSVAYKKKGRLTMAVRLIALILLFSIVQVAFQPYFLYWVLGGIVGGIEIAWVVPFVWPSAALINLASYDLLRAGFLTLLSLIFALAVYETASQLRLRYWSPVPISITIDGSGEYFPRGSISGGFGFTALASVLAMKEFRALTRRKDLARFMAIPIMIAVSMFVPVIASPGDMRGRGPGFFLAAMIPFIAPLMFATISIGQEGISITNLLSLPIKPKDLIMGKLAPAWLISSSITYVVIALMEIFAPLGLSDALAIVLISSIVLIINSFIGLGVGARWPDYTVGGRSKYITMKGFIIGFVLSGLTTLVVYFPVGFHIVTSGGVRGEVPSFGLDLLPMLAVSVLLGSVLIILSYRYCKKGIETLLTEL